jgi:hypothetical protein
LVPLLLDIPENLSGELVTPNSDRREEVDYFVHVLLEGFQSRE